MKFILVGSELVEQEANYALVQNIVKDKTIEITNEVIMGILIAIKEFLVEFIEAIALVGGGLFIILKVAGFEKGFKWAGILFVANILVKYLLGGE